VNTVIETSDDCVITESVKHLFELYWCRCRSSEYS